jgi:hypothetical protein
MSNSLVEDILAAAGQPVAGDTLTVEQMRLAIKEKRVLEVSYWSVMGEGSASFGFAYELSHYSVSKAFPPYIVFPKPIPRALRINSSGSWNDISDVFIEFGIFDY